MHEEGIYRKLICPKCKKATLEPTVVGGSSIYVCPSCKAHFKVEPCPTCKQNTGLFRFLG